MSALPHHPLAELFPMMPEQEIREMADDICTFGQRVPIVLLDGQVLDGRNRQAACKIAQLEPVCIAFDGDDPFAFVVSQNLHRRHLTESQRAMVAARFATWRRGTNQSTARPADLPVWRAAKMFAVSPRSVKHAQVVERNGEPEIIAAVRNGALAVKAADTISRLPKGMQRKALAERHDGRKEKAGATSRLLNGRVVAEITFGDLPEQIRPADAEAHFLRGLRDHAQNLDLATRVGEVLSEAELAERRRARP